LLAYEIRSEAPLAARAHALAALADWHVRLDTGVTHHERAAELGLELYRELHRVLEQQGNDAGALTAELFAPELPVTLPTYRPNPFASAVAAESSRYIDVAFDVTQLGRGKRISILDTSQGATRAEERELVRLIENTTFRPRIVDGALAESAPVRLRFRLQP
jgi:hypothetical protein